MNEQKLARGMGWVSAGVGLALLAAPERTTNLFGLGRRRKLGLILAARDFVLAAGLLRGHAPKPWLRVRALSDAADATLLLGLAISGASPRGRAALGFAVATLFGAFGFALARRFG